jgi:phosphoglycerol transferase MdoB-like AlkP superfamily enzyme
MADTPLATFRTGRLRFISATLGAARPVPWRLTTTFASSLVLSVLLFVVVQRRAFEPILALAHKVRPGPDPWLLPLALVSTSLLTLVPGVVVACVLMALGRSKDSRRAFISLASLAMLAALLDIDLLRSVGRHLTELVAIAWQPHGHVAGGEWAAWAVAVAKWSIVAVAGTWLITVACQWLVASLMKRLTVLLRRVVSFAAVVLVAMVVAAPLLLLQTWRRNPAVERLYASALFDSRTYAESPDDMENLDPGLRRLTPRFRSAYRLAFPALSEGTAGDATTAVLPQRPPNVILIVTESLRHDVFGPELMPRITRWAEGGLTAAQHDSGTMYSQSGMFALLYGRNPAVFHQTLDAGVPPQFCVSLRNRGYECAYFTGHPKIWQRREEFLNERTMDRFVHDDRGTWPEWDQRALDNMVNLVSTSEKPVFAIVLLMSSHFEYQYPPEFEIDRPVSDTAWHVTMVSALGPEAEVPHRNRYRNCIRFIDDMVGRTLDRIDPSRNLVIFTGDHGESINDDGHYTHGYTFAEIVTRTPLAMVGPNVKPGRLDVPTSHVDVLPSVLHLLHGEPQAIRHVQGIDFFGSERWHSKLEAHSSPNGQKVEAQLRAGGRFIRMNFNREQPDVTLLGFEDNLGQPLPTPELGEREVVDISTALEEQLARLRN